MVRAHLYIEGGESKEDQIRCREGFRKFLEKSGFKGRMPRLSACGGRGAAFDDLKIACADKKAEDFIALLVDSEDPVVDIEKTWVHLNGRDNREKPVNAQDDQALLMTTCVETWIAADRPALRKHCGHRLKENALLPLANFENRNRHDPQESLIKATRDCSNAYAKGKRSFVVFATLNPSELNSLPGFARIIRILKGKLQ